MNRLSISKNVCIAFVFFCATVFATPAQTITTLHSFDGTDGSQIYAGMVQGTDGKLYGTAFVGGASFAGTVFSITAGGKLTTLYNFCSQINCTDGANPPAGLVQGTDGIFYGTTVNGGANGYGTVFRIGPSSTLTTLHSFAGYPTEGSNSSAGLVQATNGKFYGTTYGGGAHCSAYGCGTVFSMSLGLDPFVKTNRASGNVGAAVKILGTDLTGATSVTFNGVSQLTYTVHPTYITTTVPTGATTGTVQVVTPGGTLSSNVPFRVLP